MDPTPPPPSARDSSASSSLGVESLWGGVERAAAAAIPDPLIGRELGGVRLVRMIAEGGMGRVYEGLQEKPARTVAVKVLRPGIVSREAVIRFANEAEILGRMRHPAIAQIHAAGSFAVLDTQVSYLVMEYVPGAVPITYSVRQRRLAVAERIALFATVIDAIAHGHSRGVIHRDLKPGNILVDADGRPKVIDFGVAREIARTDGDALTRSGQVLGTLPWMSPEQVDADAARVDARSDVYSLGVVFHEVLTDRPPYDLRDKTLLETARIIRERRPPAPAAVRRDVPLAVSRVVEKCLAKDPATRFADAAELRSALDAALRSPAMPRRGIMIAAGLSAAATAAGAAAFAAGRLPAILAAVMSPAGPLRPVNAAGAEYGFNVIDKADPFLVEATGVRLYRERQEPRLVYWGPDANDREGRLVYRFPFPRPTRSARLFARTTCFDFFTEPGGMGRGVAAVEVSRDGVEWHSVRNGIEPRLWGVDETIDEPLPAAACGTTAVWVRVRMLVEGAPNDEYTTAQFGRDTAAGTTRVFAVTATELEGAPPRWSLSGGAASAVVRLRLP